MDCTISRYPNITVISNGIAGEHGEVDVCVEVSDQDSEHSFVTAEDTGEMQGPASEYLAISRLGGHKHTIEEFIIPKWFLRVSIRLDLRVPGPGNLLVIVPSNIREINQCNEKGLCPTPLAATVPPDVHIHHASRWATIFNRGKRAISRDSKFLTGLQALPIRNMRKSVQLFLRFH
ncbi:hypothetical protein BO71DRAFT_431578 [Aspergillus ellipticus CBS 707.79]|uniref:Uncharacterized protein n=1 Tax=Aspergillus ellipticus CBS 707.79 TaxID=1448320 RepID=A0A319DNG3_9EURO|nr:hypothetical protein BO71DRAFT_431578 [Aspergillus ellipticus CBS 707.79]